MDDIIKWINEAGNEVLKAVMFLLPDSPFKNITFPKEIEQFLGYVNYYIPFNDMVNIGLAWVGAIAVYYIYQMILRNIRAIK